MIVSIHQLIQEERLNSKIKLFHKQGCLQPQIIMEYRELGLLIVQSISSRDLALFLDLKLLASQGHLNNSSNLKYFLNKYLEEILSKESSKLKSTIHRVIQPERRVTIQLLLTFTVKLLRLCQIISKLFSIEALHMIKLVTLTRLLAIIHQLSQSIQQMHSLIIIKVSLLIAKEISMRRYNPSLKQ